MRALVIEHDERIPVGGVGDHLVSRGFELRVFRVLDDPTDPVAMAPYPAPTAFDAVVINGCDWSIADHTPIASWIDREIAMVSTAHDSGMPVFGMCFGGQVLSAALGGHVTKAERPEHGWTEVDGDDVTGGPWFQWHTDRFSVPPGAVEVASTLSGPQVIRAGHSVGCQFHPEVTPAIVDGWIRFGRDDLIAHGADPAVILAGTIEQETLNRRRADLLVDWWLDDVASL